MKRFQNWEKILLGVIIVLLCAVLLKSVPFLMKKPLIGTVSGAENEFITVDGIDYLAEDFWREKDFTYSTADRGKYFGCVTNGENTMRVFTVKGDTEKKILYTLWDWEGRFYIKIEKEG